MRRHTIYLAGGLTTNWQHRVIDAVKRDGVVFYNPMILGSRNVGYIARIESGWIKDSTIMFAYIEADNQRPLCSFSELVLAAKTPRCKSIIVVDELKSKSTAWLKRFLIETSGGNVSRIARYHSQTFALAAECCIIIVHNSDDKFPAPSRWS